MTDASQRRSRNQTIRVRREPHRYRIDRGMISSRPQQFYPVPIHTGGDSMNWDAIGAIGQVLGSIAVLITLVYLSIQTRHARSESRRALSQGRAEAVGTVNSLF